MSRIQSKAGILSKAESVEVDAGRYADATSSADTPHGADPNKPRPARSPRTPRTKKTRKRSSAENNARPSQIPSRLSDSAASATTDPPAIDGSTLAAFRRRQASVAAILDETFGRLAESDPELWERRAYLMLMGTVYERLAGSSVDISTDELIALAKALAENRRVEARARDGKCDTAPDVTTENGSLPERFSDIVRQIYGTNFCDPDPKGEAASGASDSNQ